MRYKACADVQYAEPNDGSGYVDEVRGIEVVNGEVDPMDDSGKVQLQPDERLGRRGPARTTSCREWSARRRRPPPAARMG